MFKLIKIIYRYYRSYGLRQTFNKIYGRLFKSYLEANTSYISGEYDLPRLEHFLSQIDRHELIGCNDQLTVTWIMPTFDKGSGGHTTIFRFAKYFELCGYINKFIIRNAYSNSDTTLHSKEALARLLYRDFYSPLSEDLVLYKDNNELLRHIDDLNGNIIIGTCIESQLISLLAKNFNHRYLFLQDKESLFSSASSMSLMNDYLLNDKRNKFICAGKWLHSLVRNNDSIYFHLGTDSLLSNAMTKHTGIEQTEIIKIAIYARFQSERRCVDYIWALLHKLYNDHDVNIEIHTYGADIREINFPFRVINHGIVSKHMMYNILSKCHISISYSATNYTLLGIEAASLGCISYDVNTSANRISYDQSSVKLLSPILSEAAQTIFNDINFIKTKKYENYKKDQIEDMNDRYKWLDQYEYVFGKLFNKSLPKRNISVCIPTFNAGDNFVNVLRSLQKQHLVDIELCIIDSSSSDKTIEHAIKHFSNVKYKIIDKSEFGHGKTRNELAKMCSNEYILFLTQDALPLSELLAISLLKHVEKNEKMCGSFARHVAYPHHSKFEQISIENHFNHLSEFMSCYNASNDSEQSNLLKFFSSNCCCVRRELLLDHPYKDVNFGEDQLWAYDMLNKGYVTAYVPDVAVMHSHQYEGDELIEMSATNYSYHKLYFDNLVPITLKGLNQHTYKIAKQHNISTTEIENEINRNIYKYKGWVIAQNLDEVIYKK